MTIDDAKRILGPIRCHKLKSAVLTKDGAWTRYLLDQRPVMWPEILKEAKRIQQKRANG